MIGRDGRVRVMDFGLARGTASTDSPDPDTSPARAIPKDSADEFASGLSSQRHLDVVVTRVGATPGTPAYMAPEQIGGVPPDARSDQFSYCVMLWEALYGERPFVGATLPELAEKIAKGDPVPPANARRVPRWLAAVIRRGLSVDPAQRWESLPALLEGIERGRRQTRLRRAGVILGGIALVGAGLFGVERLQDHARIAACEDQGAEIDTIWNDEARQRVAESLRASGAGNAETTVAKVMPWLDARASKWKAARTEACIARDEGGVWTEERTERSLWCLEERELRFAAMIERLQTADVETVNRAVRAAAGPTRIEACRDVDAIDRRPAPPSEQRETLVDVHRVYTQAVALKALGQYGDALSTAQEALSLAKQARWTPLVREATALVGELTHLTGDSAGAEPILEAAYFGAMSDGAHDTALQASFDLALATTELARYDDAELWLGHARLLLERLDDPEQLRRVTLLLRMASIREGEEDARTAAELYREALETLEATLGSEHPEVGDATGSLARALHAMGQYDKAGELHEHALAITESSLGPDHPRVASILNNLANTRLAAGDPDAAAALLERCVAILRAALGPDHPRVATSLSNLANTRRGQGNVEAALALHEQALKIREKAYGPDHPDVAESLNNLGVVRKVMGDTEEATEMYRRAIEVWTTIRADHPNAAAAMTNLGNLRARAGAFEEAIGLQERAIAIWTETIGPEHPYVASATNNLADAHRQAGDLERARPLFERALALREKALGHDHPLLSSSLIGLTKVALKQGRHADAVLLGERVLEVLEGHDGYGVRVADAQFLLARALVGVGGDRARAKELAEAALAFTRAQDGVEGLFTAHIEGWLRDQALVP